MEILKIDILDGKPIEVAVANYLDMVRLDRFIKQAIILFYEKEAELDE